MRLKQIDLSRTSETSTEGKLQTDREQQTDDI